MDIVTGNLGWIEVICDPMFSGKSEETDHRPVVFQGRNCLSRRSADEIGAARSHQGHAETNRVANRSGRSHEANFMGPDLIEIAGTLADSGRQVIIAGLDTDYIGRPFSAIPELLALAESITKILAVLCWLWKPSQAHATSTRVRRSSRCRGRRESAPSGFPRKPEMPARITYKGA